MRNIYLTFVYVIPNMADLSKINNWILYKSGILGNELDFKVKMSGKDKFATLNWFGSWGTYINLRNYEILSNCGSITVRWGTMKDVFEE